MILPAQAAILLSCYALGCAVSAYYLTKWRTGTDIRQSGSGNAGATNAGRVLGRGWFLLIALLDILRGWAALQLALSAGLAPAGLAAAGALAVCGHLWPVQLGFRGGKGVAIGYGVLLAACPAAAGLMWGVLFAGRLATRSTTAGGMLAFAAVPGLVVLMHGPWWAVAQAGIIAVLVIAAHRSNLRAFIQSRRVPGQPESTSHTSA